MDGDKKSFGKEKFRYLAIAERLEADIAEGKYAIGGKLPSERMLANAPSEVICRNFQIGGPRHAVHHDNSVPVAGNVFASQQTENTSNTTQIPP